MAETVKKYLDQAGLSYFIEKLVSGQVKGKGLSTNDLTDELVSKFNAAASSTDDLKKYIEADADGTINKFNEIVAFLDGIADTKTLQGLFGDIASQIDKKVDKETGKGLSSNDFTSDEKTKLADIEAGAQKNTVASVAGKTGEVSLSKADVGLSNVDNTSDANKPISTATQEALNSKLDAADFRAISNAEIDSLIAVA